MENKTKTLKTIALIKLIKLTKGLNKMDNPKNALLGGLMIEAARADDKPMTAKSVLRSSIDAVRVLLVESLNEKSSKG